jgi:integrase
LDEVKLSEYVRYLCNVKKLRNSTIGKQIGFLKWFLRYSDIYNLKRSDVKDNHIEITTIKTADSLIIELNNHSKTILDKYKDVALEDNKVLPVISNQRMNDYLKELAELAEINEPIRETYYKGNERIDVVTPKYALLGTHAGRRTFICNALSLGIPAQVVMKWTGHSDYKAMKPYIDIADDIKATAMDKFNLL